MSYNRGFFKENESIWIEKYRPKTLKDLLCDKDTKDKMQEFINKGRIPSLLFEGSTGTGKSTLSNILVREIDCDVKEINASNERGIDTVRTVIQDFCSTGSFAPTKIFVLSEFSEFTKEAQEALRDVMEKFSDKTSFILTCNSVERIIPPIRGRCQEFKILPPSKLKVMERCKYILDNEKVEYDEDELKTIVDFNYPDMRKCIGVMEQQTVNGILKLSQEYYKLLRYQEEVIEIAKTVKPGKEFHTQVNKVRQLLADTRIKNYLQLYRHLYDRIDDYTPPAKIIKVILHIEDGLRNDHVPDKEINMVSTILRIFEELAEK